MTGRCPVCGQPMPPPLRAGAVLTPMKARIFDAVARAGRDGISWDDLFVCIYGAASTSVPRSRLKAHMPELNEMIADSHLRITGYGGRYVLRRSDGASYKDR